MAREFDRVMCYLGLEYPAFGMLLGLARSDRLIPCDNDYMVSTATMMAMISLWDSASHLEHGLSLVYDGMDRMCVSKLCKWKASPLEGNGTERILYEAIHTRTFISEITTAKTCLWKR
jgi:hypothetical protein